MMTALWALCVVVLMLVACIDYIALWRIKSEESKLMGWFSPFTLACQGAFAVFAAFHIAPKAFQGFAPADAIMYAELAFLLLMTLGAVIDWSNRRTRTRV
jgi:hypothetical protein